MRFKPNANAKPATEHHYQVGDKKYRVVGKNGFPPSIMAKLEPIEQTGGKTIPTGGAIPADPSYEPATAEKLIAQMLEGSIGPITRLSEALDMTLEGVARWMGRYENRRNVTNLVRLLDAQTQLLASQHRLYAVARLAEVTRNEKASPETVRRACVDMLKIQLIDPYVEDKMEPEDMPPPIQINNFSSEEMYEAMACAIADQEAGKPPRPRRPGSDSSVTLTVNATK